MKIYGQIKEAYWGLIKEDEQLKGGLIIRFDFGGENKDVVHKDVMPIVRSKDEIDSGIWDQGASIRFFTSLEILEKSKSAHISELAGRFVMGRIEDNKLFAIQFDPDNDDSCIIL